MRIGPSVKKLPKKKAPDRPRRVNKTTEMITYPNEETVVVTVTFKRGAIYRSHGAPASGAKFVITGHPQGKKNRPQMAKSKKTGKFFPVPEEEARKWGKMAAQVLDIQRRNGHYATIMDPVVVITNTYRLADRGDLSNYDNAIDDALQAAEILYNDDQIVQRVSGKHLVSREAEERVEIIVFPLGENQ